MTGHAEDGALALIAARIAELEAENARLRTALDVALSRALGAAARRHELEAENAAVKELVKLMDASLTSALTTIRVLGAENARLKAIVAGTVSRGSCKAARELTEHMTLVDAHVTAAVIACALLEAADHALAQQRFSDTRAAIEESWRGPREHAAREHTALVDLPCLRKAVKLAKP